MKRVIYMMLAFLVILSLSSSRTISASSLAVRPVLQKSVKSKTVHIKSVTLLAREEKRPPIGLVPHPSRDIGFASILLEVENPQEESIDFLVRKIEIHNVSDGQQQKFIQSPQEISLHPLENSVSAFHLTNKIGYIGRDKVKAVVTYEIGRQLCVIESRPVNVERH